MGTQHTLRDEGDTYPFRLFFTRFNFHFSTMPETCITFGKIGARVTVEDKEIQHYAMHVDPVKKVVSCWIASEAGKVREVRFYMTED